MGMSGGKPGKPGRAILNLGKKSEKVIAGRTPNGGWKMNFFSNLRLQDGEAYTAECPGGGGWGNPLERDPEAVLNDVLDGYVSPEKARDEYGVVLTISGKKLNFTATNALRQKMMVTQKKLRT